MNQHPTDVESIALSEHSYFFVGANYAEVEGRTVKQGGMYVEKYAPVEKDPTRTTPVVMIHGGSQSGTNFIATPDGRRGWLHDFLRAGYTVYVVDQPERGRSGHSLQVVQSDQLEVYDVAHIENYFTAPAKVKLWPQARHHQQWPGTGQKGDPVFDQFYASQVDGLWDRSEIERQNREAGAALLDKIGPAILLTHSQSGPIGWLIADARPTLVKAILALEPNGPPFFDVQYRGGQEWFKHNQQELARPYGITRAPMTFAPPLEENEILHYELQASEDETERVTGFLQKAPARQLPHLQGIPIMIMVAEASYHAPYDHLTSAFLRQAGVQHELIYLAQQGLKGNGHMVMLEKNNHQVADFMIAWIETH